MTATVEFLLGGESVIVPLDIDLSAGETIITGDFGGVVPAGTVARLRGNVRLIDNLHVRGTLLCDPTGVDLDGQNLFDIHTHDGTLNLVGVEKTAWCRWGDSPVGWQVGDRLGVAPTKTGVYVPSETTWQGSWAATTRPANSPDVTLIDGSIARPEVANLSQTVTLRNLKRIMVHEASAPNPQTFKWIRVLNSGETGVLGMYPIHFHMIGEHARGSIHEGVVVEGGKNHAFVPHASHGITYRGCVAYKTISDVYWWDRPPPGTSGAANLVNDSHDTDWDHCLTLWVLSTPGQQENRLTGFMLGQGDRNRCVDSTSSCVQGGGQAGGFHWPESGEGVWISERLTSHNNKSNGLFVWQNGSTVGHNIIDFTTYRTGKHGVQHGAYRNTYKYHNLTISGCVEEAMKMNALASPNPGDVLLVENVQTDRPVLIAAHNQTSPNPIVYRNCTFTSVVVREHPADGQGGYQRFEDCGLVPADFDLAGVKPDSIFEIVENGVVLHRWQSGVWT